MTYILAVFALLSSAVHSHEIAQPSQLRGLDGSYHIAEEDYIAEAYYDDPNFIWPPPDDPWDDAWDDPGYGLRPTRSPSTSSGIIDKETSPVYFHIIDK
jgi:hypothetical protein